jgi:DNA-binding response OmpR family regulator
LLYPLSYGGTRPIGLPKTTSTGNRETRPYRTSYLRGVEQRAGRVLVVDDDPVIRQLIAVNLELEGFEVVEAEDGEDGIAKAIETRPDVVTLDVMTPRMDGWVAALRLRGDPRTSDVRIVIVTARAQRSDQERGRQMGVDAYICKPFDPQELIDVVARLVRERTS